MNSFVMFAVLALAVVANCEAPSGYNYNRPSSFGSSAGGYSSGGASAISSGGNYQQEAVGGNTNEGLTVDPQLLDKIRQILLQEENKNGGGAGAGGSQGGYPSGPSSQYGAPSQQYGAPQQQYGPPSQQSSGRIVGIMLENTIPSIQVAQYRSESQSAGGYSSGPSSSYGAPSRPSSNYGAPF